MVRITDNSDMTSAVYHLHCTKKNKESAEFLSNSFKMTACRNR